MADNKKFLDYAHEIIDFFRAKGIRVDPEPNIVLKDTGYGRFDPFVPTGNYNFSNQTITLYISQRHAKDILRSFAHELIHHSQYLRNPDEYENFDKSGKIIENQILKKYEGEAYLKGNLLFRQWTEDYTE